MKGARSERGFMVAELLIALGMMILIAVAAVAMLHVFTHALDARASSTSSTVSLEEQLDELRGEAATAYAVFVPNRDIFGATNAAQDQAGHEVDFYGRTDTGSETYWAYVFDPVAHTLRRYDYVPNGPYGVADRVTGAIDPHGSYPVIGKVRAFSAQSLEANTLTSSTNVYGALVNNLVAPTGATPAAEPVGFVPVLSTPRADLYGGNTTVQILVDTEHGARTLHLATAAMPSGFTIHEYPAVRSIVYAIDQVHRSWFGLAQITHRKVIAQLQYSYSSRNGAPGTWKVWCDYVVYGGGIAGERLGSKAANYDPQDFAESMGGIYWHVIHSQQSPLSEPAFECSPSVPRPDASAPAITAQPEPTDLVDTPPPCFYGDPPCWPANAVNGWSPPSPWPASSPPPDWCAVRPASAICGGPGAPLPPPTFASPPAASGPLPDPPPLPGTPAPGQPGDPGRTTL